MTVVCFAAVRSCAVTTTAAGLVMVWPADKSRLLIEADPAGGTLAAACGLAAEPGLVSLAAAARRHGDPAAVFDHTQSLPDGTPVLSAPPGGGQACSTLSMLGPVLARLGELDAMVLVDCGRLGPDNARLFDESAVSVLVCRPQLADLNALAAFLEARGSPPARPLVVLVGPGPYPPGEISQTLGVEVVGHIPWDPDAASSLMTHPPTARPLTRSALVRTLRSLAEALQSRIGSLAATEARTGIESSIMAEAAQ